MPSVGPAFRLAFVYVAIFGWIGAYLPYWPVWLAEHGMSSTQIGILLGMAPWTRVIANPIAGRWADRHGRPGRLALLLSIALLAGLCGFVWLRGFWGLLLGMIVVGAAFAPINPLVDGVTVSAEAQGRLRYGPVRLWGSLAFIVMSWLGGEWLEADGVPIVLWMLVGLAGVLILATALLPRDPADAERPDTPRCSSPSTAADTAEREAGTPSAIDADAFGVRAGPFLAFLVVTSLLHVSHALLYALGTQHWRSGGIDEGTVGMLWALGVLAEVVLFAFGARVDRWLAPRTLWMIAGLGGVLRWSILATTLALPWLLAAQFLHALTFGALHLGAMAFIRRRVAPGARGRASTLYSAIATGLAMGIGLPAAGVLYEHLAAGGFWVMVAASTSGLLFAALRRDLTEPKQRPSTVDIDA